MELDHGMKFQECFVDEFSERSPLYDIESEGMDKAERYFIHPDSLHLLEPQEGDIGIDELNTPGEFSDGVLRTDEGLGLGKCKIIQRNGKPFFWPESED